MGRQMRINPKLQCVHIRPRIIYPSGLSPHDIQVDALFYQRLSRILRIVIPSLRSKEALLLFMHSSLLIFRTVISLYVAALDGK